MPPFIPYNLYIRMYIPCIYNNPATVPKFWQQSEAAELPTSLAKRVLCARVAVGLMLRLYREYTGIMEKKMKATI